MKKAKDDVDIQIKNIQKGIQQKKLRISELENILQTSNIGSAEKREVNNLLNINFFFLKFEAMFSRLPLFTSIII